MNELLQGIRDLKVSLVNASQSTDSSRNSRSFTCFHCKKEGHRKSDCPELVGTRGQASSTPATGANSVLDVPEANKNPLHNSNGSAVHTGGAKVGLVDSAPPMVISAATSDPKRRHGNNVGISMEEDIPMPGPSGTAHVGVPITQPTNHTGVSSVPLTALPGLPNAQELVKKRRKPRKPVRKLPVTLRRYNIWERLNSIDAGLTMGDWIYLDQEARRDLVDGARTMSAKSKKVVLNGKFKTITVEPGSKGKKRSNAQIVNAVEQWNDGIESGYDSSEWEDESDDSSVFSTDGSATTDTEVTNASLIKYPYNLQKMRSSSPLKVVLP
ncbi:hypothetical protein G6F31_014647 [Rhizopus arrhizus]|nr:hypothetical protein G6F31_014647 [Rhizopus arrhizus]